MKAYQKGWKPETETSFLVIATGHPRVRKDGRRETECKLRTGKEKKLHAERTAELQQR